MAGAGDRRKRWRIAGGKRLIARFIYGVDGCVCFQCFLTTIMYHVIDSVKSFCETAFSGGGPVNEAGGPAQ